MAAGDETEIELTPFYDIAVLSRAVTALLAEAMTGSALEPLEYAVASAVATGRAVTASALADDFAVPLTTVSAWLTRMDGRGLLTRERDPRDRRRQRISLTPTGERALEAARTDFGRAYLVFLDRAPLDAAAMRTTLGGMIEAARSARATLRDVAGW
ncbi:MAG: MarR family winged helix-turn-helix transcriptional regulator [Tetrasphaera sp.]